MTMMKYVGVISLLVFFVFYAYENFSYDSDVLVAQKGISNRHKSTATTQSQNATNSKTEEINSLYNTDDSSDFKREENMLRHPHLGSQTINAIASLASMTNNQTSQQEEADWNNSTMSFKSLEAFDLPLKNQTETENNIDNIVCKWTDISDMQTCIDFLTRRIQKPPTGVKLRPAFFGDSTMGRLYREVYAQKKVHVNMSLCNDQKIVLYRCNANNTALPDQVSNQTWTYPRPTLEGPAVFGLRNPGCGDCSTCHSIVHPTGNRDCAVLPQRFGITFSRDVILQTNTTGTTQATMAKFIQTQLGDQVPFLCIVNTGLHDMNIIDIRDETYIENVNYYLKTTLNPENCWHILWLSTTATLNDPKRRQRNSRIKTWNRLVREQMERSSLNVSILDLYDISSNWTHADNVHLTKDFSKNQSILISSVLNNLDK